MVRNQKRSRIIMKRYRKNVYKRKDGRYEGRYISKI